MLVDQDISVLEGVGPIVAKKLHKLGINKISDLLNFFPKKYVDFSSVVKINKIIPGNTTLIVRFKDIKSSYVKRGLHITNATAFDETGQVRVVWFNQPFRSKSIVLDQTYYLSGEYKLNGRYFSFSSPNIEKLSGINASTARIIPIYKQTEGIKSAFLRKLILNVLAQSNEIEYLPKEIIEKFNISNLHDSYRCMHFPKDFSEIDASKDRFNFNEIFNLSLASRINKEEFMITKAHRIKLDLDLIKKFIDQLPFKLTDDQRLCAWEIYKDLDKKHPMNRLIEGDVGSGKTVVAALASILPINLNKQVALMAPTEILAKQHANTFYEMFKPLGLENKILLVSSSSSKKNKAENIKKIKKNEVLMIIGTHALLEDYVDPSELALVIIDEQHRFGVKQRKQLLSKSKYLPHLLSLSATPIPRSLALTMFNELSISKLNIHPNKNKKIHTKIISESIFNRMDDTIHDKIKNKEQIYIVAPSISSEEMDSVDDLFIELTKKFKEYKIAKLHGKMKQEEKDLIMKDFSDNKINILISTTVIEVGIDVPNANTMLIFSPERFGLAQLHQLRGRVGRGTQEGYCYLVIKDNKQSNSRLNAIEHYSDGFKLAELDLEIRGPGHIYGVFQHGILDKRMFDLNNKIVINNALKAVDYFIQNGYNINQYPFLERNISNLRKITNLD